MESTFVNTVYISIFLLNKTTRENKQYTFDIYLLKRGLKQCDEL
jgi:hypothetical protein